MQPCKECLNLYETHDKNETYEQDVEVILYCKLNLLLSTDLLYCPMVKLHRRSIELHHVYAKRIYVMHF